MCALGRVLVSRVAPGSTCFSMAANTQTLRFRRPTTGTPAPAEKEKPKGRHDGILQDQIRRQVFIQPLSPLGMLTRPVQT